MSTEVTQDKAFFQVLNALCQAQDALADAEEFELADEMTDAIFMLSALRYGERDPLNGMIFALPSRHGDPEMPRLVLPDGTSFRQIRYIYRAWWRRVRSLGPQRSANRSPRSVAPDGAPDGTLPVGVTDSGTSNGV